MNYKLIYKSKDLNITEILKEIPPTFTHKIDYFNYIIHLILSIQTNNKSITEDGDDYVHLKSVILDKVIPNYKRYLDYLEENLILSISNSYTVGKQSKGYRLNERYLTNPSWGRITDFTLVKKLNIHADKQKPKDKYNYITKWFNNNLHIDTKNAKLKVEELYEKDKAIKKDNPEIKGTPENKRMCRLCSIMKIEKKIFEFKFDNTSGRFHSNLTNMKKELRKFITYNGERLCSSDIKNCQPVLTTIMLNGAKNIQEIEIIKEIVKNDNKISKRIRKGSLISLSSNNIMFGEKSAEPINKSIELYRSLTLNGEVYEYFQNYAHKKYNIIYSDRNEVKKCFLKSLYSSNRYIHQDEALPKRAFQELFPGPYAIFSAVKKNSKEQLPLILQAIEAYLILDVICKRISLETKDCFFYTVHDSIAYSERYKQLINDIIIDEFKNKLNITPRIGDENWF